MKEIYCNQCGTKLVKGGRFCAKCGAPVPQQQQQPVAPTIQARPSTFLQGSAWQPPYSAPPPKKRVSSKIALIAGACALGLGVLVFGVYMLFLKPSSPGSLEAAADSGKLHSNASAAPAKSPVSTHSSGSSRNPSMPTKTWYYPVSPQNTPEPIETPTATEDAMLLDYSWIIGYYDVPGITEEEAYEYLGDPQYRETIDTPDAVEIYLNYGSFILKFLSYDGETSGTCFEVQIISTPCPIEVYGLEIEMDSSAVDSTLAGSPFELTYEDPDGSYWVFSDPSAGHELFINFADGSVWDYAIFYSP